MGISIHYLMSLEGCLWTSAVQIIIISFTNFFHKDAEEPSILESSPFDLLEEFQACTTLQWLGSTILDIRWISPMQKEFTSTAANYSVKICSYTLDDQFGWTIPNQKQHGTKESWWWPVIWTQDTWNRINDNIRYSLWDQVPDDIRVVVTY